MKDRAEGEERAKENKVKRREDKTAHTQSVNQNTTNLLIYHQTLLKKDLENDCTFLMSKYRVNISVRYTNNHQKFD